MSHEFLQSVSHEFLLEIASNPETEMDSVHSKLEDIAIALEHVDLETSQGTAHVHPGPWTNAAVQRAHTSCR